MLSDEFCFQVRSSWEEERSLIKGLKRHARLAVAEPARVSSPHFRLISLSVSPVDRPPPSCCRSLTCGQYFSNVSANERSYCCDRSGFFCQRKIKEVFSPNHVVAGNFRAGEYTTMVVSISAEG